MTKEQFIKRLNQLRRISKGWYELHDYVDNQFVKVKAYKTWVQILDVDGIKDSGPMDCTVKQFNEYLNTSI